MLITLVWSCQNGIEKPFNATLYTKHIQFNHLYIVIDDTTYNYLLDSLNFLDRFSINMEMNVNAGEESWVGKYLFGKNNYVEIFKPGGFGEYKLGGTGLGFMTDKLGILDSLYGYWNEKLDSVTVDSRDFVKENGDSTLWFRYITFPDKDSVPIKPWLMEYTREHMLSSGFTDNDLLHEFEFWDYMRSNKASSLGVSPDSIKYNKLFDKITSLHLILSDDELSHLRQSLNEFGFEEKENTFSKDDFEIRFSITEARHFILNQIDFSLLDTLKKQKYSFRNLELLINGNTASLKFNYY